MKTQNSTIRYASKQDYLNKSPTPSVKEKEIPSDSSQEVKAKESKKDKVPEKVENKVKDKVDEAKSAGKKILSEAGSSLIRGLASVAKPSLPSVGIEVNQKVDSSSEVPSTSTSRKLIDKPGIFFVRGFSLNPFEGEKEGLGGMAGNIPHAQVFKWGNKDEIIESIKSRPHGQPIILVGHGMGGDTIVDVANELNQVEHGFRQIDLLVTLDSVGSDNDIIPQNVKDNFNLISDESNFFRDGPNVARKKEMTFVSNELRSESHDELEKAPEVQFLVYEKINQTLMNAVAKKNFANQLDNQFRQRMMSAHRLDFNPSSIKLNQLMN
jgi:hypothetical protein